MRSRLLQSKQWLLLSAAFSGLLVALLAAPLYAGNPKTKKHSTHQTKSSKSPSASNSPSAMISADSDSQREPATIDVLSGLRSGKLAATAKGRGDGKVTLSLTNKTDSQLRVILPPGVIFSGASGQFGGGMGGMGGGMGMGMGGMGGGMGGMGGMGGGMMGGRGGMMGGGMRGGGTMPASMGMMMLARLIMYLAGDYESWDQRSLMIGMMGMRGGMGMGGGMMGGMGGGMMGGMGGMGMMSVPATGPLETTLKPQQERHLPTAIVSMNPPDANSQATVPADGETLRISAIEQWTDDKRTLAAFKQLAKAKAPPTVAQMVMWYVTAGANWDDVGRLSQGWGNASEIALARRFVADLNTSEEPASAAKEDSASALTPDRGTLYWDIKGDVDHQRELIDGLRAHWGKIPVLGLTAKEGVPARPDTPALACQFEITENAVDLKLTASHPSGSDWILIGKGRVKLADVNAVEESLKDDTKLTDEQRRERKSILLGDALAKAMVARLVRVQLSRGPRVKGKESFRLKIINDSPLILNGMAVAGSELKVDSPPAILLGMSLPPLKTLTVPATAEVVARLKLKDGSRVVAVDLSGL